MNKLPCALIAAGASILMGVNAHAANLVQNPGFDTTTNWTLAGSGIFALDLTNGQPTPAALVIAADNSSSAELHSDCIQVTAQQMDLYVDMQIHTGGAGMGLNQFSDTNCTVLLPSGQSGPAPSSGWITFSNLNFSLGSSTQSVIVVLVVGSNPGGPPGSASFDNIRFGPAGTTPVRLQSFEVD